MKRNITRFAAAVMALTMGLSLAACGDGNANSQGAAGSTTSEASGTAASGNPAASVLGRSEIVSMDEFVPKDSGMKPGDQLAMPSVGEEIAVVTMEDGGTFKIRFFPEEAPKTVYSFKQHAVEGYYDGLTFHRIIQYFMNQGGDPDGQGTGGESIWGEDFEDEFSANLLNIDGSLAMANRGPATNGSQFFINYTENPDIAGSYSEIPPEVQEVYGEQGGNPHLDGYYNGTGHTVFGQVFEGMETIKAINSEPANQSTGVPESPVVIKSIEIVTYEG